MIDGEPRLVDRDGERMLVDANGDALVCCRQSPYTHGCYHRVDIDRYDRDGSIKPRCEHVTGYDEQWVLRRHAALAQRWNGCLYAGCYGDEEATMTRETGPQLAAALREMSVADFDAAVSDHHATQSDEGEWV